jgi:hypothetical protein
MLPAALDKALDQGKSLPPSEAFEKFLEDIDLGNVSFSRTTHILEANPLQGMPEETLTGITATIEFNCDKLTVFLEDGIDLSNTKLDQTIPVHWNFSDEDLSGDFRFKPEDYFTLRQIAIETLSDK